MRVQEAQLAAPLGLNVSQDRRFAAVPPPLLATKLAMPSPAPSLVIRPRLTARLQHAGCRVVLVVAPAGSGKSSLVSQWCQEHAAGRVAWLSLDAEDNDVVILARRIVAAAGPFLSDDRLGEILERPRIGPGAEQVDLLIGPSRTKVLPLRDFRIRLP